MSKTKLNLDRIHVASPCSADWDRMQGEDDKVRFCFQCGKNVYNFSNMSRREAAQLIVSSEQKICAKFYRRAGGTVLTADCPVGLRAVSRRVSRFAGATLSALLSLMPGGILYAQQTKKELQADGGTYTIARKPAGSEVEKFSPAFIGGVVFDVNKSVVPNARVTLIAMKTKEVRAVETNDEGVYEFSWVEDGVYTINVEATGFRTFKQSELILKAKEMVEMCVTLEVGFVGEIITIDKGDRQIEVGEDKPSGKIN